MCAAPGSKTAQLIEFLHADEDKMPTGKNLPVLKTIMEYASYRKLFYFFEYALSSTILSVQLVLSILFYFSFI